MADGEMIEEVAGRLAQVVKAHGLTVAVAESLTSGSVSSALGRAEDASEWFAGAVVAYLTRVKRQVLGVTAEGAVSGECAEQMAGGVAELTAADVGVSTTGVGGPDSEEGKPVGTVWVGVASRLGARAELHRFDGAPADVVRQATLAALRLALSEALRLAPAPTVQVS